MQSLFPRFLQPFLRSGRLQPVFINDGEPIERGLPITDRHGPFLRDIAQRQIEQFQHCLVVRQRAAGFGHFAQ